MATAHYRLETKIVSRKTRDRSRKVIPGKQTSVVAKAAYRSGQSLKDERAGKTFNYRSRTQEVAYSEIMVPEKAPDWLRGKVPETNGGAKKQRDTREQLWNTIERVEKRKDSQLAREFVASLPRVLNREQQIELIRDWCRDEFVSKGYVVDVCLHKSKNGQNPHAHVLVTMRPVAADGFGLKPSTAGKFNGRGNAGFGAKDELVAWRESYARYENKALEKAGRPERVDHRSLKDQGIDRIPQPKIGVEATAMKNRGVEKDPKKHQDVRCVELLNDVRGLLRSIQATGSTVPKRNRAVWLEQSRMFLSHVRDGVSRWVSGLRDSWADRLERRREVPEHSEPER